MITIQWRFSEAEGVKEVHTTGEVAAKLVEKRFECTEEEILK